MQTNSISTRSDESSLLRNALRGNALFSTVSGVAFVVAAQAISTFVGLPFPTAFVVVGLALLPFAYVVYRQATAVPISLGGARTIIALDVIWVLLSGVLLWLAWDQLTVGGRWFVALQADIVLLFAIVQTVGVRRLS